ncbi:MAG: diacylglycerol kinase family protein, partial [Gemmatimonas sp.]
IHLLVNPAAGNGRARQQAERAYAALRTIGPVKVVESTRPRDETRLATEAVHANAKALVVLGGDGSVTHAARGLIAARSNVPLGIFAAGTGNDFVKSLGVPAHDFLATARLIANGTTRLVDAGEMDGVPFVNAAGVGFDVEVLQHVKDPRRRLRMLQGTTLYVVTALQQLFRYRGFSASVDVLNQDATREWLTVVFANGQYFGGAFRIAPHAELTNGLLDVVGIADVPAATRAALFARALRGAHMDQSAVHTARAAEFTLHSADRLHFQADGEPHHASSRTIRVRSLPNALRVVAP